MRLINVHTLEMEEFLEPPRYAILSHRWVGKEITYEQYLDPEYRDGPGGEKVRAFCEFVRQLQSPIDRDSVFVWVEKRIDWVWVDTCCIDKRSSAELSEAINSMWSWYRDAEFCVAYLVDVSAKRTDNDCEESICKSEWFTRGWTLQELLAPRIVLICNAKWETLGTKRDLTECISRASGIDLPWLLKPEYELGRASVAQRMSWASRRKTTRKEDEAYCLFGLFDVYMPLIYGEGERAFRRLQEEIIRRFNDDSIHAWSAPKPFLYIGPLAGSPLFFRDCAHIRKNTYGEDKAIRVTNNGLEMTTSLLRVSKRFSAGGLYVLRLNCCDERYDSGKQIAVVLCGLTSGEIDRFFARACGPSAAGSVEKAMNAKMLKTVDRAPICIGSSAIILHRDLECVATEPTGQTIL